LTHKKDFIKSTVKSVSTIQFFFNYSNAAAVVCEK
jgi:hypothetical protein